MEKKYSKFNEVSEMVRTAVEENPTWIQVYNGEKWFAILPDGQAWCDVAIKSDEIYSRWKVIHTVLPADAAIVTVLYLAGVEGNKSLTFNKVPNDFYETQNFIPEE